MPNLKILTVASEKAPYAKTGGLADVLGALPKALAMLGHEVKVVMPSYRETERGPFPRKNVELSGSIELGGRKLPLLASVAKDRKVPIETYFIRNEHYYDRTELYRDSSTGKDYVDNDERFAFLALASLELTRQINFQPDIIHVHDWQAGLVPVYLKTVFQTDAFFARTRTVLTIHNLAYQGTFDTERFAKLGLPESQFVATGPLEFYGKVNFLKGAIVHADKITTVSPRYAEEIQSDPEVGAGLDGVLRHRTADIRGILNGVDYTIWSPSRDRLIPFKYHKANLSGKRMNRVELLNHAGLPIREGTPLIGVVSRLADQKGFDLIATAAEQLFARDIQMIVLGTGEEKYHTLFNELQQQYPDKLRCYLQFDNRLAHLIEAASDVFLMPSRFEPCGLNQLYSLKYGTVPVVRRVGGLADTVINFDDAAQAGNGIVFEDYTPDAMLAAIDRAIELFQKKRLWMKIMKAGMSADFSWRRSANEYAHLFESLVR